MQSGRTRRREARGPERTGTLPSIPTGAKATSQRMLLRGKPSLRGREQAATWQHENSLVQPQEVRRTATEVKQEDAEGPLIPNPGTPQPEHGGLLNGTAEGWACAFVRALKCKLCPDIGFVVGRDSSGIATNRRRTLPGTPSASSIAISRRY